MSASRPLEELPDIKIGDDLLVYDKHKKNPTRAYVSEIHSMDKNIQTARGIINALGYNGRAYEAVYWLYDPKHLLKPAMDHAPHGVWEVAPITSRLVSLQTQLDEANKRISALEGAGAALPVKRFVAPPVASTDGADPVPVDDDKDDAGGDQDEKPTKLDRKTLLEIAEANGVEIKKGTPTWLIQKMLAKRERAAAAV